MSYKKIPPGTIVKDKINQTFDFPGIGHKMTLYVNVYHNVPVSHIWWYENLAACFQVLANEASKKAKEIKERESTPERPEEDKTPIATEEILPHAL